MMESQGDNLANDINDEPNAAPGTATAQPSADSEPAALDPLEPAAWPSSDFEQVVGAYGPPLQQRFTFADAAHSLGGGLMRLDGRLARSEYWWGTAILACIWIPIASALLLLTGSKSLLVLVAAAVGLLVFVPFVVVLEGVRAVGRLHDVGHPGWWAGLLLVPFGFAAVLWLLTRPGTRGANQFGPMSQPGWDRSDVLAS